MRSRSTGDRVGAAVRGQQALQAGDRVVADLALHGAELELGRVPTHRQTLCLGRVLALGHVLGVHRHGVVEGWRGRDRRRGDRLGGVVHGSGGRGRGGLVRGAPGRIGRRAVAAAGAASPGGATPWRWPDADPGPAPPGWVGWDRRGTAARHTVAAARLLRSAVRSHGAKGRWGAWLVMRSRSRSHASWDASSARGSAPVAGHGDLGNGHHGASAGRRGLEEELGGQPTSACKAARAMGHVVCSSEPGGPPDPRAFAPGARTGRRSRSGTSGPAPPGRRVGASGPRRT